MRRGRFAVAAGLAALTAIVAAWAWIALEPQSPSRLASAQPTVSPSAIPSTSPSPKPWNLDEDVGSIVVLSWAARTPWSEVSAELVNDQIGGALLFGSNFGGTAQGLKALDDQLVAIASSSCKMRPFLTMLDEEGGNVASVRAPFAPPSQMAMASGGAAYVHDLERANGAGLSAAGIGLDLAPVADVRTNSLDDVIGTRSFGSNPSVVTPLVAAAVRGLHDGGVGATVKHFPGLGGAAGDPHFAIPIDPETQAHWDAVQLPGFQAGVQAGADAVMVTAVYVPGLGAGNLPAVFSPAVVGRIRTQLAFDGVVMTDSLSMGGIGAKWSLPQAAVMALAAGNDMLLLSNGDPAYEAGAIAAVKAAVRSGRLSWAQIHTSARRVNALREQWGRRLLPCPSGPAV